MDYLTYLFSDIQSIDQSITSLIIPYFGCNDINNTINCFSRFTFTLVESIEISNECFSRVETFQIEGLNRLKSIKIGNNSFTQNKNSYGYDLSKSFHILNCESLESIQIDRYSFSDFAGEFELSNLPQLQSIHIGVVGSWSHNFFWSSFVIRGIYMILNIVMNRSSSTIYYIR